MSSIDLLLLAALSLVLTGGAGLATGLRGLYLVRLAYIFGAKKGEFSKQVRDFVDIAVLGAIALIAGIYLLSVVPAR
ncbi:hypothetical protein [Azohydromonas aeria]|uniref:hypothetical protein n=1 Tax=Azohydromonas aeria TaxID=2590212 RepID=UPI0012F8DDB5|nr:hypothetical protein [Azohydromonas aeria]